MCSMVLPPLVRLVVEPLTDLGREVTNVPANSVGPGPVAVLAPSVERRYGDAEERCGLIDTPQGLDALGVRLHRSHGGLRSGSSRRGALEQARSHGAAPPCGLRCRQRSGGASATAD